MIRWLIALIGLMLALPAAADELRPGYLAFTEQSAGEWHLVWKAPLRGGVTPATRPILPDNCRLLPGAQRTRVGATVVTSTAVRCAGDIAGKTIGLSGFTAAQTDALARVQVRGRPVMTLRLTAANPVAEIPVRPGRWQVARTYFIIGVEHILFGFDHLLFVVSLVLLLRGIGTTAAAVTAFTVAHSITLVGAALGQFAVPSAPVEAIIALSILFLAAEIVKHRPGAPRFSERAPWLVAFVFGLLHGFGFAGALAEIGLPETDVPLALLTFNLGVEAGQLGIVIVAAGLLATLRRWAPSRAPRAVRTIAYGIGIIAAWWFIDRMIG